MTPRMLRTRWFSSAISSSCRALACCRSALRLVGQPQHDLDQRRAQRLGDAEFGRGEGLRAALDQFLPLGEAFARGQARAVGAVFDRLVRIAGPAHRPDQLGPEQHDIVARRARDRNRQHARPPSAKLSASGDQRRDMVGRVDLAGGRRVQRADDPAEIVASAAWRPKRRSCR